MITDFHKTTRALEILTESGKISRGWTIFGDEIQLKEGESISNEILAAAKVEAENEVTEAAARAVKRSALFSQWESLPAWIKGPYRATFAAAVELLDAGQDEEAVALIQYEDAKAGYTSEQKETFEMVRAEIVAAMENLG